MPPRDQNISDSPTNVGVPALDEQQPNTLSFTDSTTKKLVENSRKKAAAAHNTPTNTGWRRKTFHWELNLWTFAFLAILYHFTSTQHGVFWKYVLLPLIASDAARYYYARGTTLPGVPYTLPLVSLVAMLVHPVRFWAELAAIAMESDCGMCTNILGGSFMIFVTDTALCRKVMTGEGTWGVYAHPNALWLFGPRNLIYLDSEEHKKFRAILTPALFSNQALIGYAQSQESVCRRYLRKYCDECKETGKPIDARIAFRSMAAASSQEAFLGPYLTDAVREHLEKDIVTFTLGFLSFPFPYFRVGGLHQAIQAKDRIEETIQKTVKIARDYVKAGNKPRCLLEHWSLAILQAAEAQGCEPTEVPYCADDDVGRSVIDFLFAAQDATNSALTYSLDVLDDHRDVLDKMRQEIDRECTAADHDVWTKIRDTKAIPYTAKVANQLLHHKPPVPMIPHLTKKNTTLAGRRIAKGTVVIPSITYSARTSGASVDFLPEREDADPLFVKTLTFAAGQHKCPGRRYAESLLTVFLAVLSQDYDFERVGPRPKVDEFVYYPTTFPKDCDFIIKERADEI